MSRVEHVDRVERVSYNPDVLSCLANLSNDEVFTPPAVVNQIREPEDEVPRSSDEERRLSARNHETAYQGSGKRDPRLAYAR